MITGGNATVFVSNMDRAIRFYTDTLGLKLHFRAGDHFAQVGTSGLTVGLHPAGPKSPRPGQRGSISIGLGIDRPIDQEAAALAAKGVAFRGPIVDDKEVKLAFFGDPDGNELYLCETVKKAPGG